MKHSLNKKIRNNSIRSWSNFFIIASLLISLYFLIHFFIGGITSLPSEGDSINAHIPFAKAILNGTIFESKTSQFYPASAEIILVPFLVLNLPLNLYNLLAVILLFLTIYFFGRNNNFPKKTAFMYAFSVCTLYGVFRYINTQKIDIYVLIFYTLSLAFLQKPTKSFMYFLIIGFLSGMLVGSKYSGPFYAFFLFILYGKGVFKKLTFLYAFAFIVPFLVFGLSWYIRNYINFNDPFYPQDFLFFKGESDSPAYSWPYWKIALAFPRELLNAFISEYMIWIIPTFVFLPTIVYLSIKKGILFIFNQKLILLCLFNLLFFFILPAPPAHDNNAIVFGIRYSFPFLLLIIFLTFSIAQKIKKELVVFSAVFINAALLLLPVAYHPKLFILIIVSAISFYFVFLILLKMILFKRKIF